MGRYGWLGSPRGVTWSVSGGSSSLREPAQEHRSIERGQRRHAHDGGAQLIRVCPSCGTGRPLFETSCGGTLNGRPCGWNLFHVPITAPAATYMPEGPRCPNGHLIGVGSS